MKLLSYVVISLFLCLPARAEDSAASVRKAIEAFYAAFGDGFSGGAEAFATEDWNHINPFGGRTRGRDAVLKEVVGVHSTFLKGVTDTIDNMDVRFADPNVAIATVVSHSSPFKTPDGVSHPHDRSIRTFIVVRRGAHWLIMQDQNTIITQ